MNAVERGHESLVRGHRSRRRALVGSDGLNNEPLGADVQTEAEASRTSAIHDLGGKATQRTVIPPTPTEVPPADYAG